MTRWALNISESKKTMRSSAADFFRDASTAPLTASPKSNVIKAEFYTPESYIPLNGARPLKKIISELEQSGFSGILKEGRKIVSDSFKDGDRPTLRSLRLSAGLTQEDLALKIGVKQYLVSKYENGQHDPSMQNFKALCAALEVDANTLLKAIVK